MQTPTSGSKIDNFIILLFNDRLLMMLGALIVPLIVLSSTKISENADPLILYLIISLGFMAGLFVIQKSLSNPVIPYLLLQMVLFFIFLDKKIMANSGLNLKLYADVFMISSTVAFYHLIKHFKYLWNTFPLFKYLFIYFVITAFYLIFHYYSDFRLNNDVLSLRYAQTLKVGTKINSQVKREFGDMAQFVLYIDWLIPIICTTISLMLFKGLKTIKDIQSRFLTIIKYFTLILLIHFSLASLTTVVGLNDKFINVYGENDPGTNFFFTMLLLVLLSFKYYISNINFENDKEINFISKILTVTMLYDFILIIFNGIFSEGSSSMILALFLGLPILLFFNSRLGLSFPFFLSYTNSNFSALHKMNDAKKESLKQFLKTLLTVVVVGAVLGYFLFRMFSTYSSKTRSVGMRIDHWKDAYYSWIAHLGFLKVLIGYGLDRLLEVVYYASNSSAIEQGIVSPHNMFLLMIYNQGLVSFLFFGAILSTVANSIKSLKDKTIDIGVKIFSSANIAIITSVFVLWFFVDMTLILRIIFFCIIGMIESVKHALNQCNKELDSSTFISLPNSNLTSPNRVETS